MPYVGKWIPAIVAIAYVTRVEKCDRATAIRQIETAVRDGALRWVRDRSSRWDWDAEVLRRDVKRLWPAVAGDTNSVATVDEARVPSSRASDVRKDVEAAAQLRDQPLPASAECQRLREALAALKQATFAAIRAGDAANAPADIVEDKCSQAATDIEGEIVTWLGRGQLQAFLETAMGLERLPSGSYWSHADGAATAQAKQVLAKDVATSPANTGLAGTVMVGIAEFRALAEDYLAVRGLAEDGTLGAVLRSQRHQPRLPQFGEAGSARSLGKQEWKLVHRIGKYGSSFPK